jgi:hypothetical protein
MRFEDIDKAVPGAERMQAQLDALWPTQPYDRALAQRHHPSALRSPITLRDVPRGTLMRRVWRRLRELIA